MSSSFEIRPESSDDFAAVFKINARAFESDAEARLVDALRVHAKPLVSLVAVDVSRRSDANDEIVGHILFSPVTLSSAPDLLLAGLAPMAVSPDFQKRGIGAALIRAGLDACRACGFVGAVVLGHPEYYPRFGFVPSLRFGFRSEYEVPENVFMALELQPGVFGKAVASSEAGVIRYHAAFANL